MNERELVQQVQCGDRAATGELFSRFWRAARAAAFGVTGEWASAEDAASEGLRQALANIGSLQDPGRFPAWLRTIVVRVAQLALDRRTSVIDGWAEHLSDPGERPDQTLERLQLAAVMQQAVRQLPGPLREAIALFYFEGYDSASAARFLDVPSGTLRRRLHQGRTQLRSVVEEILKGNKTMDNTREQQLEIVKQMLADGNIFQATRESLALRPPPNELKSMFFDLLPQREEITRLVREHCGRSPALDPSSPAGAIVSAIQQALPEFQEWQLEAPPYSSGLTDAILKIAGGFMKKLIPALFLAVSLFGQIIQEVPQKARVTGKVISTNGAPVRRPDVKLLPLGKPATAAIPASASEADGTFEFTDVEPGTYRISGKKNSFLEQFYGARRPGQPGSAVRLVAGQTLSGVEIKLTPAGSISGKILDEDGEPMPKMLVYAHREVYQNGRKQLVPLGQALGTEKGEYSVGDLMPGKYFVSATSITALQGVAAPTTKAPAAGKPEMQYGQTYYPNAMDQASATPIEIGPGMEMTSMNINMRQQRVFRLRGKINDPNAPQAVLAYSVGGGMANTLLPRGTTQVGSDRTFEIPLAPGNYRIIGASAQIVGGELWGPALVSVVDKDVENVVLVKATPLTVTGKVSIENPNPASKGGISTLQLALIPEEISLSSLPVQARPDEDGAFTMEKLQPGKFTLFVASIPDGGYIKRMKVGEQDSADHKIDLSSGAPVLIEILVSGRAAKITGFVTLDSINPLPGATVVLIPTDPALRASSQFRYGNASSGEDGAFAINNVYPGSYKLFAWEEAEQGAWFDPDFLAKHESKGVAVTVAEGDNKAIALPGILSPDVTAEMRAEEKKQRDAARAGK